MNCVTEAQPCSGVTPRRNCRPAVARAGLDLVQVDDRVRDARRLGVVHEHRDGAQPRRRAARPRRVRRRARCPGRARASCPSMSALAGAVEHVEHLVRARCLDRARQRGRPLREERAAPVGVEEAAVGRVPLVHRVAHRPIGYATLEIVRRSDVASGSCRRQGDRQTSGRPVRPYLEHERRQGDSLPPVPGHGRVGRRAPHVNGSSDLIIDTVRVTEETRALRRVPPHRCSARQGKEET